MRTLAFALPMTIAAAACQVLDPKPGALSVAAAAIADPNPITTTAKPPASRVDPVTDKVNGVDIKDDYRWLEGDNADPKNMGKINDEVGKWTDAQNAYTREVLDSLPGRKALEERLKPLMEVGSISAPQMKATRYFYSKREGTQNQANVFVRDGYKGEPKLLLDPSTIDASGLTTIAWYEPTDDGKLLAYGTYRAGDENSTLHVMEVDTGKVLPLAISGKVSSISWLPDSSGFVYRNLSDVKNPYSGQVMYHAMGTEPSADKQIVRQFTPDENKALATTYGPDGGLSQDGRWLVLSYATDTRNNDLWVADFKTWQQTGKLEKRTVAMGKPASFGGDVVGDLMFMQTTYQADNGRVVLVDLTKPEEANWKTIIPERKDAVIQGVSVAKDVIAVNYLKNASSTIELFDLSGKSKGSLKLPGIGSAGLATDQKRSEAYLTFNSYNYPASIFRVDLANPSAEPELWERPAVPVDPRTVEVKQEWYSSKDGTKVSMFIIHKKGLELNGNNPTILYGYGGFKIALTPSFSAPLFSWFEDGGVYVVANLRGGGEYGDAWHDAGRLDRKQNVFDDFAAAAEYLIQRKYTSAKKLAVMGGSNGGLLTGVFVTQHPDLCKAAIVAVPLLDMIRYQNFLMAKYWVPEYGSAENAGQFDYILKYSPYQNIKKGTKYPAVLLTAGENDSRVHPLHARKMAAALQAATTSNPASEPVLLWVDREAGHGQGKPLNLRIRDAADTRIFLMWQLGMLKDAK
ncbi:MAG: S9 family peptidase [Planctomycetes bacterium]|nr:S9 family peptidase [Planctomycetota bacterium]